MDLERIIRELTQERDKLQRIIDSLEEMEPIAKLHVRPANKRRKSMGRAARVEVSERMKRYWAQRKAELNTEPRDQDGKSGSASA